MTPTHAISADEARRLLAEDKARMEPGEIRWVPDSPRDRFARYWRFICFCLLLAMGLGFLAGRFVERFP